MAGDIIAATASSSGLPLDGGCTCGKVRYRMRTEPLFVHGQKIVRCPECHVALWSHYAGAGDAVSFVRVGTLDEPDRLPPQVHIFTASKQPWVVLPEGMPAVPGYYDREELWPAASLDRRRLLLAPGVG